MISALDDIAVQEKASLQLRITEIFRSLQGESESAGWPTVFVRLTGCPLRCVYCDTAYAFTGGERLSLSSILEQVASYLTQDVCVTGGEPLAQPACLPLLTSLCDEGYSVSLETSGALSIEGVDPRVRVVMDLKTPSSGEAEKNRFENIELLKPDDEIKFVIGGADDFKWAIQHVRQYQMDKRLSVLMSPVFGEVTPLELAEWILESGLRLRFQQQLHKLIWGNEPGH